MTTQQKYERNKQVYELYRNGTKPNIIAKQFNITTQTVRNIAKTPPSMNKLHIETTVIDLYNESIGVYRERVKSVAEVTGLDKCQVRYIIGKYDKCR